MTKTRRKIDAGLKAKIAVEVLREQATVKDLAQRYQGHPNQIYGWKKQLLDHAARAFDPKVAPLTVNRTLRHILPVYGRFIPLCRRRTHMLLGESSD